MCTYICAGFAVDLATPSRAVLTRCSTSRSQALRIILRTGVRLQYYVLLLVVPLVLTIILNQPPFRV